MGSCGNEPSFHTCSLVTSTLFKACRYPSFLIDSFCSSSVLRFLPFFPQELEPSFFMAASSSNAVVSWENPPRASKDTGLIPQGRLSKKDSRPCKWSVEGMVKTAQVGNFLPTSLLFYPEPETRSDWFSPSLICFFEYPFKIGHKLPFGPLTSSFLKTFNLAPSQVMPSAWRILLCCETASAKHGIPFTLAELMFAYLIHQPGNTRFSLKAKPGMESLILNTPASDKSWPNKFFFAEINSLGPECSYLSTVWNRDSKYSFFSAWVFFDLCRLKSCMCV